jgi:hypothetical protein
MRTSDMVIARFRERWVGTEDELANALDAFFDDIRDSMEKAVNSQKYVMGAGVGDAIINTVCDYFGNNYSEL